MKTKALVVIDIQNDITKHYRDIIGNINAAIDWAVAEHLHIVYIKHNNTTAGTRTFKPGSKGEELVPNNILLPKCNRCTICHEVCPKKALKGVCWNTNASRDEIVDVDNCITCLKCLACCPKSRAYMKRAIRL